MNKYKKILFIALFYASFGTTSILSQVGDGSDLIWSIVNLDPNKKIEVKQEINWSPAEQVERIYDFLESITVSPNFRPHPTTNTTQSEVSVDVHPSKNDTVFCSANATDWPVTGVYGTGVYWTLNGGVTWGGADDPSTLPGFGSNRGDPVSVIGIDGRFYENYISSSSGQGVAVSTNYGANWTTYTVAPNPGSLADKNHYMVDKHSGSPYVNRSYCAWTDFGGTNNYDAVLRYSSNYGQTWSSSINLSNALSSYLNQGVNIQTGPNGEVYAVWAVYIDGSVSTGEDGIGFSKSTNGGVTWSTPTYVYQVTNFGIRGTLSSKNGIRVSSFPSMAVDRSGGPNHGTIYVTWPQRDVAPAGSTPDIVFVKSTDGGNTWSSPALVNDVQTNDQYYPWCTVDQATGQFMIVFYDSRNVPNSQTEVYMARSTNGGITFENFKVSDQPHTPAPISGLAGGYAGDYIGVAALGDVAYPYWGDNRTGIYQGWMAKVEYGPPCPVGIPSNPNPLNGATGVSANLSQLNWTNGAGATECEVWFGESGLMTKVYDGSLTNYWTITSPLEYSTQYYWRIVCKDANCGSSGPTWNFTTENSPGIVFFDTFEDLNCWTSIGPLGIDNWSLRTTSNAGGNSPELRLSWTPAFNGLSKFKSCAIPVLSNRNYSVSLLHMLDYYSSGAPTLGIGVSYDDGATFNSIWSFTPTGNVGPESIEATFTTPANTTNLYLILYCDGDSYNIDYWYVDDIILNDDDYFDVNDPTSVLATAINGSQIDLGFTPNSSNNNVVVVWNLTGTFTVPTGTPPAIGQPFAGGTLLYNGTTSPVNHTGLSQLTTYYYKLFSYNGTNYSPGISTNATTFSALDFGIDLIVSDNCNNSVVLVYGTAPGATDCYDAGLDQSAPPPPPVGAFDARFESCGEDWFTDIRGTNLTEERIWDVYYTPATGCEPVSFGWNPSELPADGYFHLVDPIYGNLVNVNMRTANNYTDEIGLGHLQIKYNYQFCSNYNIADGWNMLSLPLDVSNNNYLNLFPNAEAGTLFGYLGTYYTTETILNGIGYWLKFQSSQIEQVCGDDRIESVVGLNTGWNIIGGPNCNVPLGSVSDPGGIIVPGTLYGYSGSYVTASSIDGTKAYWIRTNASGTITVSCGAESANQGINLAISPEVLINFSKIEITDADENNQNLYFDGELDDKINIESFSLPPLPPPNGFDARFTGGYRLSESDEVTIQIQSSYYPLKVKFDNLNENTVSGYKLLEIAEGVNVGSNTIEQGKEIIITNNKVTLLKITKEESIPTVFNLEQNYPNPFNPATTIKFSLPEPANVSLNIYNTLGQKVKELVNTNLEAGRYNYQWDASNHASGIYIYELRTDKFVSVKKMILMK